MATLNSTLIYTSLTDATAVKLRLLADEDIGLLAGNSDADRISLRQVRDLVEREVAAGHAVAPAEATNGDGEARL